MTTKLSSFTDPDQALAAFCRGFLSPDKTLEDVHPILPDAMPPEYRRLLVHNDHMTTTLRKHHGCEVRLKVRDAKLNGDFYERDIVLLNDAGEIIEVGLVRINLEFTTPAVRSEILARKTPLGDVLINADVMRRIEPRWFFQFGPGCHLLSNFADPSLLAAYGRLGTIYCDGAPAIELLEIVIA